LRANTTIDEVVRYFRQIDVLKLATNGFETHELDEFLRPSEPTSRPSSGSSP
jgi:hypothetical protein